MTAPAVETPTPTRTGSVLEIRGLTVSVEAEGAPREILTGVDLTVRAGETHAIMGPNGSGKSTLAYAVAGHPKYTVTGGTVTLDGEDVLAMSVDERARAGLFLAMQYPVEVPGVSVSNFLRSAASAVRGEAPKLRLWVKEQKEAMARLQMDPAFSERSVNEGFSGGEKKRHEILQLELLKPRIAILDETDSGLDVDALRVVSEGVNRVRESGDTGVLLITHYTRILNYIRPDFVHVFVRGRIAESGGAELADELEENGYEKYGTAADAVPPAARPLPTRPGAARCGEPLVTAVLPDVADLAVVRAPLDVEAIRADFPVLSRTVHGHPLVYLDNASSSHRPVQVLDAEREFVARHWSNVHRGVHTLSQESTETYEQARSTVAAFFGGDHDEIVFTKNATEAYNLVAYSFGNAKAGSRFAIGPGDEVCVTEMEHHSNLVPWQMLCERTGATLRWFPLTDDGRLDLTDLDTLVNERTKVLAFVHVSNLLGTENPVDVLVRRAREVGALVLLDGAQSAPHQPVSVLDLGVDFYVATGHKMLGPSGVGLLWGKKELLDAMPPFMGGGSMIEVVQMSGSTYAPAPERFEAGTPVVSQAVALAAACHYLTAVGLDRVQAHERLLTARLLDGLRRVPGVRVVGPDSLEMRGSAVSFTVEGVHPHDVGQSLDDLGIAVRVGHHCAAPVCRRYGVPATARASSYLYNTEAEIDRLLEGLDQVRAFWSV